MTASIDTASQFSPHAWGWTGATVSDVQCAVLDAVEFSPHAWGWTDALSLETSSRLTFSPHAWGWTANGAAMRKPCMDVFPTRVGVDRQRHAGCQDRGPFSPHAWGWTGPMRARFDAIAQVFPTRVGVDR